MTTPDLFCVDMIHIFNSLTKLGRDCYILNPVFALGFFLCIDLGHQEALHISARAGEHARSSGERSPHSTAVARGRSVLQIKYHVFTINLGL